MHSNHKTNRKALVALIGLTAALGMPLAFAQDAGAQTTTDAQAQAAADSWWAELDSDKNGTLSETEASANARIAPVFADADADADGQLTAEEYRAYHAAHAEGAADVDVDAGAAEAEVDAAVDAGAEVEVPVEVPTKL